VQIIFASIILLKKRILKLMAENNEITDLSQIIKEQANFYNIIHAITLCPCDMDKRPTAPAVLNERTR
jgi:hypothetical protein